MLIDLLYLPPGARRMLTKAIVLGVCPALVVPAAVPRAAHAFVPAGKGGASATVPWTRLHEGIPPQVMARFQALAQPSGGFVWQAPMPLISGGVAMYVRHFHARLSMGQAVQALARNIDAFQGMMSSPGLIRLSGFGDGGHWLAELQPVPEDGAAVSGRVSFMAVETSGLVGQDFAGESGIHADHPLAWLPAGAIPLFNHGATGPAQAQGGTPRGQYGYRVGMPIDSLAARIALALAARSWATPQQSAGLQRLQVWQPGRSRMLVFLQGHGPDSIVYIHIH